MLVQVHIDCKYLLNKNYKNFYKNIIYGGLIVKMFRFKKRQANIPISYISWNNSPNKDNTTTAEHNVRIVINRTIIHTSYLNDVGVDALYDTLIVIRLLGTSREELMENVHKLPVRSNHQGLSIDRQHA